LPAYTGFAATLLGGVVLAIFSVIAGHWSDNTSRSIRSPLLPRSVW
jgi:hypothetical protein